jgi:hypothetical protein
MNTVFFGSSRRTAFINGTLLGEGFGTVSRLNPNTGTAVRDMLEAQRTYSGEDPVLNDLGLVLQEGLG